MGNDEIGRDEMQLVEKQDVDVDGTVVIDAIERFSGAPKLPLYLLREIKDCPRRQLRVATDNGIEEVVGRRKAPRD